MDARGSRARTDRRVGEGKWKIPETTQARLRGGKAGGREPGGGAIDGGTQAILTKWYVEVNF